MAIGFRGMLGSLFVAAAIPTAFWLSLYIDPKSGVPVAVVVCVVLGITVSWPLARERIAWPGVLVAMTSLISTAYIIATGYPQPARSDGIVLSEVAGLLVLVALVARWSPARTAVVVGTLLAAASTGWILRFIPDTGLLSTIGGCVVWSLGAVVAAIAGSYPRLAAARLQRSVASARQSQRLQLAHDLHDFVAHDVTGMVAQAQAARFAGGDDPAALRAALERVESAGQEALSAMDTLVEMLRDHTDTASSVRAVGLAGLPGILERFQLEREQCTVTLCADDPALAALPTEIQLAATRAVIEALTNVRRHAAAATRVTVTAQTTASNTLRVLVTNDRSTTAPSALARRRSGGTGLTALGVRIQSLGGRLDAGPDHEGGWSVRCELPTSNDGRRGHVRS